MNQRVAKQCGRQLRNARLNGGRSLRHLAHETDIHYTQLWAFEHGHSMPGFWQLRVLCKHLGLNPIQLLGLDQ